MCGLVCDAFNYAPYKKVQRIHIRVDGRPEFFELQIFNMSVGGCNIAALNDVSFGCVDLFVILSTMLHI